MRKRLPATENEKLDACVLLVQHRASRIFTLQGKSRSSVKAQLLNIMRAVCAANFNEYALDAAGSLIFVPPRDVE